MTQPIRTLIVGLGNMGRNWLRVLQANPRFEIVGLVDTVACDTTPWVLDCLGAFFHKRTSTRFDAAIVATPSHRHGGLAMRLLEQGADVLVEKPLALTYRECESILAWSPDAARRIVVGHVERFNSAIDLAQWEADRGTIGVITHVDFVRAGPYPKTVSPGNNVVLDLAVHDLDLAFKILGILRVTSAECSATVAPDVIDHARIELKSARGPTASVVASWTSPEKIRTIRYVGTTGVIDVDLIRRNYSFDRGRGWNGLACGGGEPLAAQADAFADFVQLGRLGRLCDGIDAANAVLLAEQALGIRPARVV